MIPIIINETGASLDSVVKSLVEMLHISGENIDKGAARLLTMTEHNSEARASVEVYLIPFWTNMTGNYGWS